VRALLFRFSLVGWFQVRYEDDYAIRIDDRQIRDVFKKSGQEHKQTCIIPIGLQGSTCVGTLFSTTGSWEEGKSVK